MFVCVCVGACVPACERARARVTACGFLCVSELVSTGSLFSFDYFHEVTSPLKGPSAIRDSIEMKQFFG